MKKVILFLGVCVLVSPCLLALCGDSVWLALGACAYGFALFKSGLIATLHDKLKNG